MIFLERIWNMRISYPTTDMNLVVDFQKSDLDVISSLLNARLSPLLERIYGISKNSIRANDMFIVRYDGKGQQALRPHTDYSHISFNILLNDGFVGGGTRFYHRLEGRFFDARPKPGDVLINNAMVSHEGLATTKGKDQQKKKSNHKYFIEAAKKSIFIIHHSLMHFVSLVHSLSIVLRSKEHGTF